MRPCTTATSMASPRAGHDSCRPQGVRALVVEEADRVRAPYGQGRVAEDAEVQRRVVLGAHQVG
jgi:hypothetical protein